MQISVQQASENLTERIEDLREQVSALKAGRRRRVTAAGALADRGGPAGPAAVVWVDDFPENNAYEVDVLRRKSVPSTRGARPRRGCGCSTIAGTWRP